MKLKYFRIKTYKSIHDSEKCWIAGDITLLAGKNESGKSAILEALRDFDRGIPKFSGSAEPLDREEKEMGSIELCFSIDDTDLSRLEVSFKSELSAQVKEYLSENGLSVYKFADGSYKYLEKLFKILDEPYNTEYKRQYNIILDWYRKLRKYVEFNALPELSFNENVQEFQTLITQIITKIKSIIPSISSPEVKEKAKLSVESVSEASGMMNSPRPSVAFFKAVELVLPTTIYFNDFDDMLPFDIAISEIDKKQIVMDCLRAAGLDIDELRKTTEPQKRKLLLSRHSAIITGDFADTWKQDHTKLSLESEGANLRIWVVNPDNPDPVPWKPEQRSRGFQWFLSFYLRLHGSSSHETIILIDEPGLYLHAQAQKDVLKVLEKISKESQIIISTHSPYLIDPERIDRIRLVQKNDKTGTTILSKPHNASDSDTLTPIITALGLDVARSLAIPSCQCIVVEGITDYYYLQSFRNIHRLKKVDDIAIIPCKGATTVWTMASFVMGLGFKFVVLLDRDREGKKADSELASKFSLSDNYRAFASDKDEECIEDILDDADFVTHVLARDGIERKTNERNSKLIKREGVDEVLLAQQFFLKTRNPDSMPKLSDKSRSKIEWLMKALLKKLKAQ